MLRGGYGVYWAPFNYQAPSTSTSNYGQVGFTQNTLLQQTAGTPTVTLDNPFPLGVAQPSGNSKGLLSGLNGDASFVDQNRSAPRVQQWSADLQREIGNGMALTFTYMGAKGDHLPLGGSNEVPVNWNQLDPKYLALGAAALGAAAAEPVPRQPERPGIAVDAGHAGPFAAAQAVPAVQQRLRAAGHRRPEHLRGRHHRVDASGPATAGAAAPATPTAC